MLNPEVDKKFWQRVLSALGWKVKCTVPEREKCIICVAPHTSNWDFPIGLAAYKSIGRKANFLMKEFWFFFPLNIFLKALGGIPVPKKRGGELSKALAERFKNQNHLNLAVTPEGTRSGVEKWRRGFLYIAYEAKVLVQLGVIDYSAKCVMIEKEYAPTGDIETDMQCIKSYYCQFKEGARYPEKFII